MRPNLGTPQVPCCQTPIMRSLSAKPSPISSLGPCIHTPDICTLGHTQGHSCRNTFIDIHIETHTGLQTPPGISEPLTSCPCLLQLDGRAASIHHLLTSDSDPHTCTSGPAFLEVRVRAGLDWCGFWKAPLTHCSQLPARQALPAGMLWGWGLRHYQIRKENEDQNSIEGHLWLAPGRD